MMIPNAPQGRPGRKDGCAISVAHDNFEKRLGDLPFVRPATPEEYEAGKWPRIFWSVDSTGDYSADFKTGERFAQLALDCIVEGQFPFLLGWVVFSMIDPGNEHGGIEAGFLAIFGDLAAQRYSVGLEVAE